MNILVTGGAGFIGSAVIRYILTETDNQIINLDKLTYAGNLESLESVSGNPSYRFVQGDVCDQQLVLNLLKDYQPDAVMHLAAESHVDRSIHGPSDFVQTNIVGTMTMLECIREYLPYLSDDKRAAFRFHHISTDEVYGSLDAEGLFTEQTAYDPSSPYSATKASSDHLVRAWHRTYGLPVLISNCSNNYGPYHFPEKLIPLVILNAIEGKSLPVYGNGQQIRDWLFVDDHARALYTVVTKGEVGETYNIGGHNEKANIDVVNSICTLLDELRPRGSGQSYCEQISFVADRPGHDQRYAIDANKIKNELGWAPVETFETGLRKTVEWYLNNSEWVSNVKSGQYREWVNKQYGA